MTLPRWTPGRTHGTSGYASPAEAVVGRIAVEEERVGAVALGFARLDAANDPIARDGDLPPEGDT